MRIECLTVCVNYSDIYCHIIDKNARHFDKMVVVTHPTDKDTIRLCNYHQIKCIQTNAFYENGASFAKGRAINVGLQHLSMDDWIIILDADILLPPGFKNIIKNADLDPTCIYGMDRYMINSINEWMEFIKNPKPHYEKNTFLNMNAFPLGQRFVSKNLGFLPMGFAQLYNAHSNIFDYPQESKTAATDDLAMSLRWPKQKRRLLTEVICMHLASQTPVNGENWESRTSPAFQLQLEVKEEPEQLQLPAPLKKSTNNIYPLPVPIYPELFVVKIIKSIICTAKKVFKWVGSWFK